MRSMVIICAVILGLAAPGCKSTATDNGGSTVDYRQDQATRQAQLEDQEPAPRKEPLQRQQRDRQRVIDQPLR